MPVSQPVSHSPGRLISASLRSSIIGAVTGAVFPLTSQNISLDRSLMFLAALGAATVAGNLDEPPESSFPPCLSSVTAALTFKLLDESIPVLNNNHLTLFLISMMAPSLIAETTTQTKKLATNVYNWWNRPSPSNSYQRVEQDDLADMHFIDIENLENIKPA